METSMREAKILKIRDDSGDVVSVEVMHQTQRVYLKVEGLETKNAWPDGIEVTFDGFREFFGSVLLEMDAPGTAGFVVDEFEE